MQTITGGQAWTIWLSGFLIVLAFAATLHMSFGYTLLVGGAWGFLTGACGIRLFK
jgi:hypothetical protein